MLILLTFNTSNLIVGFRFCQTEVSASHLKLFGRLGLFLIEQRDSVLELSRIVPGHFVFPSFKIYFVCAQDDISWREARCWTGEHTSPPARAQDFCGMVSARPAHVGGHRHCSLTFSVFLSRLASWHDRMTFDTLLSRR